MEISTEILNIKSKITDTFTSLSNKNVTIPEDANSDNIAELIESIPYYTCPNGTQWTQSNITEGDWHIVYGGGIYVACSTCTSTSVLYSTDGITWTASNITARLYHTEALKYHNGIWVLGMYAYSTDGINWLAPNMTNIYITNVEYINGVWVCGSYIKSTALYYSTDGMTWNVNLSSIGGTLYCLKNINGIWFACLNNKLFYSTVGLAWTECSIPFRTTNSRVFQIIYSKGIYLTYDVYTGILYYSYDGFTWIQNDNIVCSVAFKSLEYANGLWVANTTDGLQYSTDGINWTQSNITEETTHNEIYYINDVWFAYRYYNNTAYRHYYSYDGMNWFILGLSYQRIVQNNHGIWLTCTGNTIQYSSDNTSWNVALRNVFANELLCEDNIWLASYATPYNYNYNTSQSNMGIWYSKVWEQQSIEETQKETEITETE